MFVCVGRGGRKEQVYVQFKYVRTYVAKQRRKRRRDREREKRLPERKHMHASIAIVVVEEDENTVCWRYRLWLS